MLTFICRPFVDRLPEDVLHIIFCWLSVVNKPALTARLIEAEDRHVIETLPGWLYASHVCQRWRGLILRMPLLWAGIAGGVFASRTACETIIERAGEAALHFWGWQFLVQDYRGFRSIDQLVQTAHTTVAQLAPRYLFRLERLALRIDDQAVEYGDTNVPIISDHRLPQLKELYVDHYDNINYTDLALDAPMLVSLRMNRVFLSFRAPNLRYLRIDRDMGHPVPLETLLTNLACSCLLEELELHNVFAFRTEDSESPLHSRKPVQLQRLAFLRCESNYTSFLPFWAALDIPPEATISLRLPPSLSQLAIFPHLRQLFAHPDRDTMRLSISEPSISAPWILSMQVYNSTADTYYDTTSARRRRASVQIGMKNPFPGSGAQRRLQFVSTFVAAVNTDSIRFLDLDMVLHFEMRLCRDLPLLQRVLRPLVGVTTVLVGRDGGFSITKDLLCRGEDGSISPLFPRLQSLVIKHPRDTIPLKLDKWPSGHFGSAFQLMEDNWAAIVAMCSELSELGCPLKSIHAAQFSVEELGGQASALDVQERWISRVRELVEDVVVTNPND